MTFKKMPMNLQFFADGGEPNDPQEPKDPQEPSVLEKVTEMLGGFGQKLDGFQSQIDKLNKTNDPNDANKKKDPEGPKDPKEGKFVSFEEYNELKQKFESKNKQEEEAALAQYANSKAKEAGLTLDKEDLALIQGDSKESIDAKVKSFAEHQKRLLAKFGNPDLPKDPKGKSKKDSTFKEHLNDGKLRDLSKYRSDNK